MSEVTTHQGYTPLVAAVHDELQLLGALGTEYARQALHAADRLPDEVADKDAGAPELTAKAIENAFLSVMMFSQPGPSGRIPSPQDRAEREQLDAATRRRMRAVADVLAGRVGRTDGAAVEVPKVYGAVAYEIALLQCGDSPDARAALHHAERLDNQLPAQGSDVEASCRRIHECLLSVRHLYTQRGGRSSPLLDELFTLRVDLLAQRSGGRVKRSPGSSYAAAPAH